MSKKRTNYMHRADKVFSKLIRDRDGACRAVGFGGLECKGNLQCAHIITRAEMSIRTSFDNAVTLCAAHHTFYTYRPTVWQDFVDVRYPGRWDELRAAVREHRRLNGKVDWKLRYETLKEMADSLGVS